MKEYSAIKRETNGLCSNLDWSLMRRANLKTYVQHDTIYRLFLNWEKCKNGEQVNGCWRLRGCEQGRSVAIKGQHEGSLWRWRCSVSRLYQCQYLVVKLCFSFKRYFPWGKLWKRHTGSLYVISYNCMWIYNDLKIKSLMKIFWMS